MSRFTFFGRVCAALVFLLAMVSSDAASIRGVQLVLLSRWSKASCDNFLAVATQSSAPTQLEIAFVPYCQGQSKIGSVSLLVMPDRFSRRL